MSTPFLAVEAISKMERGESVLRTFGKPGRSLKRKIAPTGFICRVLLFFVFNPIFMLRARFSPDLWHLRKVSALRLVRRLCPFDMAGHQLEESPRGQVAVINHPTLNDPICGVVYILSQFIDREIVVPVNLPWFESVCRYRQRLLKIGINLVPILTPQTATRLGDHENISRVQSAFMANYVAEFVNTLSRSGLAIVAQQATRQRYLFTNPAQAQTGEDILSTVTLLLLSLKRAKQLGNTQVVPVGVVPHSTAAKPRLNIFRRYKLVVGEPIPAEELNTVKNAAKRPADLHILQKLMELVPHDYHFQNTKTS